MQKLILIASILASFSAFASNSTEKCSTEFVSSYNELTEAIIDFKQTYKEAADLEANVILLYKLEKACKSFYGQYNGVSCIANRNGIETLLPSPSLRPLCDMVEVSLEFLDR